jgi:hypothetical protein
VCAGDVLLYAFHSDVHETRAGGLVIVFRFKYKLREITNTKQTRGTTEQRSFLAFGKAAGPSTWTGVKISPLI